MLNCSLNKIFEFSNQDENSKKFKILLKISEKNQEILSGKLGSVREKLWKFRQPWLHFEFVYDNVEYS